MTKAYGKCNFAKVYFKVGKSKIPLSLKIDTGASRTVLPNHILKHLNPHQKLEEGEKIELQSASEHTISGYMHNVFIKIEGIPYGMNINVVFCDVEKYLLGIDAIQKHFKSISFGPQNFTISS